MKISGLQKTSLIDYPDKIAAIVFTQGCPFRCGYCYNPELLSVDRPGTLIEKDFFNFLNKRKNVLDALVITGGEPTLQPDLPEFIKKVRKLSYLIKLDTNGTNPEMLKKLLKQKLLDYIAMDIKAPASGYNKVTNVKVNFVKIKQSIKLIMESGVDYEFRSTILPRLHNQEDLIKMAKLIKGAKKYYLQKFTTQSGKLQDGSFKTARPFIDQEMMELAKACSEFVKKCEVR